MIIRPDYINKIVPYIDAPFVKILSGVRRSGKSTLLKMVADQLRERGIPNGQILMYPFDSLQYEGMTAKLLYNEVKGKLSSKGKTYLFLDEIQEVENWEKAVNSMMVDFDADIYVTGSNSRMMSGEISTYLTGRYVQFHVYTLSFAEYLTFRKQQESLFINAKPVNAITRAYHLHEEFARYLRYGGFPATHSREYSAEEVYAIVRDIYNATVFSDIVRRSPIRKVDLLERIVKFTFDNIGKTFSAASISRYLKAEKRAIDNETVYSYIKKLENAFILHRCPRYDLQGKELLKTQEKFYVCDPAMKYSVLGYTSGSAAAMLENVVYLELLRRGYHVTVGQLSGGEIDFVAARQEQKLYVQIAQSIESEETEKREYGRLLGIKDNYPKYVLRTDEWADGNYRGIITMHVADFLLSGAF